ncbi:MAG: YhfC family intramembrane metalloprotease [Pseudobutyrivibrio sp.]|nr:YhfC family intramembrane metalloprotease [Pseudobutyrivibrio sp.]
METVSYVSIIGMCFALLISVGLPVALMIYAHIKLKADIIWCIIGAVTFIIFAMLLEQVLHSFVLKSYGDVLNSNVFLLAIYGGIAAGLFEELGRFVSMKLFQKKLLKKQNAFMYGVGHGGCEAILIVGLTSISNIITSFMINSGAYESILSGLEPQLKEQTLQQVSLLWKTDSIAFYLGGIERIIAITLHICLSYIVYRAVTEHKAQFLLLSIAIHALIDIITVVMSKNNMLILTEIVLIFLVTLLAIAVIRDSKGREVCN